MLSYCQHFCQTFPDITASNILPKEPGHWISELHSWALSTSAQGVGVSKKKPRRGWAQQSVVTYVWATTCLCFFYKHMSYFPGKSIKIDIQSNWFRRDWILAEYLDSRSNCSLNEVWCAINVFPLLLPIVLCVRESLSGFLSPISPLPSSFYPPSLTLQNPPFLFLHLFLTVEQSCFTLWFFADRRN